MKNNKITLTLFLAALSSPVLSNPFVVDKASEDKKAQLESVQSEVKFLKESLDQLMAIQEAMRKKEKEEEIAMQMTEQVSENLPPDPSPSVSVSLGDSVEVNEEDIPGYYGGFIVVNGDYFLKNEGQNGDLPYIQVSKDSFANRLIENKKTKSSEGEK